MGLEIEMVGNTIEGYDDLTETFDEVIAKKKAMLILESQEQAYIEALQKKEEAEKKVASAQADVIEKQNEIKALEEDIAEMKDVWFLDTSKAEKQLEELESQERELENILWDREEVYNGYVNTMAMYQENERLYQEGNYDSLMASTKEYFWFQVENNDASEKEMFRHYLELQEQLEDYKTNKEALNDDRYDKDIEQAEKELALLEQSFIDQGLAMKYGLEANTEQLLTGLGNMISQASGKKYEFKDLGDGTIQAYLDGIAIKEPIAQENFETFATDLMNELDLDEEAKTAGSNLLEGLRLGISDSKKQNTIFGAVTGLGAAVKNALKKALDENSPSKATQEMGEFFDEGLKIGIDKQAADVVETADNLGLNVLNRLKKTLNTDISVPDIDKNVLLNTTTDFSSSKALVTQNESINDLISSVNTYMPEILKNMKSMKIVLDSKTLVGEIAPQMDSELGVISSKRKRGRS